MLPTVLFTLLSAAASAAAGATIAQYYPAYSPQTVKQVPWQSMNVAFYFTTLTTATGIEVAPNQPVSEIKNFVKTAKANGVKPVFTVGGWSGSKYFSSHASTDAKRKAFASALKAFSDKYGFAGADLDWEYPGEQGEGCNQVSPKDAANFTKLLKEIRRVFGKDKIIAAAVNMRGFLGSNGQRVKDASEFGKYLDFLNLMAYDVSGPWSDGTGPLAPLYQCASSSSVETGVNYWMKAGIPASKILLGVPSYAISFRTTSSSLKTKTVNGHKTQLYQAKSPDTPKGDINDVGTPATMRIASDACGLSKRSHNLTTRASNGMIYTGHWQYANLIKQGVLSKTDPKKGLGNWKRYWDDCTRTPFLFNSKTKVLISYDDADSIKKKAEWAKKKGLGGLMVFSSEGFTSDVNAAMVKAIGLKKSAPAKKVHKRAFGNIDANLFW
ncbi:hypothetical protein OIV83_003673 [Microbotryomycetes sp. JL201]|nr:hypothetical protein OIV83_003673 [Microbotryomycetes sp. JL201]